VDETVTSLTGTGDRHEDYVASTLVKTFRMIMDFMLLEGIAGSSLSTKDQVRATRFLDEAHPAFCVGIHLRRPPWQQYTLHAGIVHIPPFHHPSLPSLLIGSMNNRESKDKLRGGGWLIAISGERRMEIS
jgi:hypothetical protein